VAALGQRSHLPLRRELTDLGPGANVVRLTLAAQLYHARVTHRGAPLAATVDLRPLPNDGREVLRATAGEDGELVLPLPRPGAYSAEVMARAGPANGTVPAVRFGDPADSVEIRLPEGEIAGTVVDDQGAPVARARISAEQVTETPAAAGAATGGREAHLRAAVRVRAGRRAGGAAAAGAACLRAPGRSGGLLDHRGAWWAGVAGVAGGRGPGRPRRPAGSLAAGAARRAGGGEVA
jgi:hypothetical protein